MMTAKERPAGAVMMPRPRYALTINPDGAGYVVTGPDGSRPFKTFERAVSFIACMDAVERDIARLVRCHGLGLTMQATRETFGGQHA